MSRRKKKNLSDDILDLVSLLPWWVGVALAVIAYLSLHAVATSKPAVPALPGQLGPSLVYVMITAAALVGQYVVPLLCLAGAVISVFRRKQRQALTIDVAQAKSADALNDLTWIEFELLVGEAFRLLGFSVLENGGGGPDGGIDLILTKGNEKFLVQCKQWKAFKVGVDVVRELYGVMAAKGAVGGFVVTSGRFTDDAIAFAEGRNVKLIDGPKLFEMIQQAKKSTDAKGGIATKQPIAPSFVSAAPQCPRCDAVMVKRTARKGGNAGEEFWGCSKYPACRGVRPLN